METGGKHYFPDDERAAQYFDDLVVAVGGTDVVKPQQIISICDLVRNEVIKDMLWNDICKRGVEVSYYNGRQTLKKDNPSISRLAKIQDQTRRTMMALGLIAREKPRTDSDDDDDDEFDEF